MGRVDRPVYGMHSRDRYSQQSIVDQIDVNDPKVQLLAVGAGALALGFYVGKSR